MLHVASMHVPSVDMCRQVWWVSTNARQPTIDDMLLDRRPAVDALTPMLVSCPLLFPKRGAPSIQRLATNKRHEEPKLVLIARIVTNITGGGYELEILRIARNTFIESPHA